MLDQLEELLMTGRITTDEYQSLKGIILAEVNANGNAK